MPAPGKAQTNGRAKTAAYDKPLGNERVPKAFASAPTEAAADPPPPPPPTSSTLPSPPSPPGTQPAEDEDRISFGFPEYNNGTSAPFVQVTAAKESVSQGPAAKRAKMLEDQYSYIKDKVNCLEKNVNKRIDRLQGTVSYMAKCVEDFNENFAVIMEVVRDKRAFDVADSLKEDASFPLQTTQDVENYLEKDPQAVKAIDRLVPFTDCIYSTRYALSSKVD